MMYYSTHNRNLRTSLKEAVLKGLAPDKGLFMPVSLPLFPTSFFRDLHGMTFTGLSFELACAFFKDDLPENELRKITEEALTFETPLVQLRENVYSLELFHGPTLAFKDVGARYMARILASFTKNISREIHVLVATSGDTGSAVANGFLGVEGIKVHILYPQGKVSLLQEKQFTTLGRNITALEVDGSFDDCQRLVKEAFNDPVITEKLTLTSANSINLARLIPQCFYYFNAFRQLPAKADNIVFSVPSGNFGNLTAGLIAKKTGLPVAKFLAATNCNDVVPEYLETGIYRARPSKPTIANAMDVGDPSNFARILDLYGQSHQAIAEELTGYRYTDSEIMNGMARIKNICGYISDPHGATAYNALEEFLKDHTSHTGIFLETAHPAKFSETVEESLGIKPEIPARLAEFAGREKVSIQIPSHYNDFREYLQTL